MRNVKNEKNSVGMCDCIQSFNCWNDDNVAFIKADVKSGQWLICSANGTRLAATEDRDFAFVIAKQNELLPKSVH